MPAVAKTMSEKWCARRDVMWESQFGIPRREEDLKGSRRELDRLAIFLRCVPSVAKVATRVVFFKQNVRRALRGAKDKNSRGGGGGRWDLYICWHGSASTSINRGLDDRWSRRFLAMATTISLSLCPRFIVTVMIIRLFADKLSLLATVWKNKFFRIFRIYVGWKFFEHAQRRNKYRRFFELERKVFDLFRIVIQLT